MAHEGSGASAPEPFAVKFGESRGSSRVQGGDERLAASPEEPSRDTRVCDLGGFGQDAHWRSLWKRKLLDCWVRSPHLAHSIARRQRRLRPQTRVRLTPSR